MSPEQQDRWTGFFNDTQDLTAVFLVTNVVITGDFATATVTAQYGFRINQNQVRDDNIVIRLRQEANGWRILAVE